MQTLLVIRNDLTLFSPDGNLGGQTWKRFFYLVPFYCPRFALAYAHEITRKLRSWWPVWFAYRAGTSNKPKIIFASGRELLERELRESLQD